MESRSKIAYRLGSFVTDSTEASAGRAPIQIPRRSLLARGCPPSTPHSGKNSENVCPPPGLNLAESPPIPDVVVVRNRPSLCRLAISGENAFCVNPWKELQREGTVESIDITEDDQLAAVCRKGNARQRISLADLPLPSTLPEGAEWIVAYRYWRTGAM